MTVPRVLSLLSGAAALLAVTGCGTISTPSAPGVSGWQCAVEYVPGAELASQAGTYGVISLTIVNNTPWPVSPADYQV